MIAIILGLLAMFCFGISNAVAQQVVRVIGAKETIVLRNLITSAVLLPFVFLFPPQFSLPGFLLGAGIGILGFFPLYFFYQGLSKGAVGVITPIANTSVLVTVLLALFIDGEYLSIPQFMFIGCIIAGVFLVGFHKARTLAGVGYALLTALFWGVVFYLWQYPAALVGAVTTAFLIELFVAASSLAWVRSLPNLRQHLIPMLVVGALGATAVVAYTVGILSGTLSVVVALTMASPWVAALYGRLVLKEKLTRMQWLGLCLSVVGVALLASF